MEFPGDEDERAKGAFRGHLKKKWKFPWNF